MSTGTAEGHVKLWLSIEELAERLDLPLDTLRKFRARGTGPRGVRMGKRLRFHIDDVLAWERARREAGH